MEYIKVVRRGDKNTRVLLPSGETRLVRNSELSSWIRVGRSVSRTISPITYGCEFECVVPISKRSELAVQLERLLGSRFDGATSSYHVTHYNRWQWGTDGSIHAPCGYFGVEIKSPILSFTQDSDAQEVKKVVALISDLGGKVNCSTGTHIHLGFSQSIPTEIRHKLFDTYGAWEDAFFDRIVSPSRRNNRYCKSCRDHDYNDRYHKLNLVALDRYGTLEFRQHQGTLSGNKVLSWIAVCRDWLTTVTHKSFPQPSSFEDALEILEASPAIKTWIRSRCEDFAD